MSYPRTAQQIERSSEFRAFAASAIEPFAADWDREQQIPASVISALAERGYLGCNLPLEYGGLAWNTVTCGLLIEAGAARA